MARREEKLKNISYIRVPQDLKVSFGSFKVDPDVKLPVERKEGKKSLDEKDITMESIIAGMITVVAYDEKNPSYEYYKAFINAVEPRTAEELNKAAIAKEQAKDYDFAEELFLAVYHLMPQSASAINLATLYSYRSVEEEEKKNEDEADRYLVLAKNTLLDALSKLGENEDILKEISSFEGFLGNLESALSYGERYMKVASEGKAKEETKEYLKKVRDNIESDEYFKAAYDFIMLDEPDKALDEIGKFLEKNNQVWNGHFLKAWALRKKGEYSKAKESLLECIRLGESNSDIYNELSICELEEGDRELAKTYLDTAVDLDGENLTAVSNLAYLHLMDDEFDQARYFLEKARSVAENDLLIKDLIEIYEEKTGDRIGSVIKEEVQEEKEEEIMEKEHKCCHRHGEGKEEGHCCHRHEEGHECSHDHEEGHCCHGEGKDGHECSHDHESGHCCHHE